VAGRTLWKGYLHFGDIDLAVKLQTAVKEERLQFHLLHQPDQVKLQQQMVCPYENVPVPKEEQAKGFEVGENKYILIDPMEFEETEPESSRKIEIHEFVRTEQINPLFFEKVYYLEPETTAKGYGSLVEVIQEMGVQGICTWTMRKRSYFGALQAIGKILRLQILRYADEIIPVESFGLKEFALSEKELDIGRQLIDHLTVTFQPQKFVNEHQQKLQNLIDQKARGEKIVILRPKRLKATAPDNLLQVLEASLKKVA
jgi:DNA end-binding protein Ku